LRAVGLTGEGIRARVGSSGPVVGRRDGSAAQVAAAGGDALGVAIRLLVLATPVPVQDAERTLGPLYRLLTAAGALEQDGDEARGTIALVAHDDILVASDVPTEDETAEFVPNVHRPSKLLAQLTVRRHAGRVLDLGTGNGIQALLAARHADEVVATDLNPRAVAFARFNAALNGRDNVEVRTGSYFEPVAGEQFDLVVANPPYVISPDSTFLYRDSGLAGATVSEQVVQGAAAALAEGGYATVLVSWGEGDEPPAEPPPLAWTAGCGCDAWLLRTRAENAATSAAAWNVPLLSRPHEHAQAVERWTAYYADRGYARLAYGAVILRRRSGAATWARADALPQDELRAGSAQIERVFEARAAQLGDAELLAARPSVVDGALLSQELEREAGGWSFTVGTLRLADGLGLTAGLDVNSTRVVTTLSPLRPLCEVLDDVAAAVGIGHEEAHAAGVALVRSLYELGFVTVDE
jgi:SAM-dependent methyltransferase